MLDNFCARRRSAVQIFLCIPMLLALSLSGCAQQEPNAELQAAVKQDAKAIVGKYFEIPSGKSFLGFDDWTILAYVEEQRRDHPGYYGSPAMASHVEGHYAQLNASSNAGNDQVSLIFQVTEIMPLSQKWSEDVVKIKVLNKQQASYNFWCPLIMVLHDANEIPAPVWNTADKPLNKQKKSGAKKNLKTASHIRSSKHHQI